jgi:hypothetical protein
MLKKQGVRKMQKLKERGNGSARKGNQTELQTTERTEGRPSTQAPRALATASPWLGDPFAVMHRFAAEILALLPPVAAVGYSLIYLLFGGGLFGAVVIFVVAKMFGK